MSGGSEAGRLILVVGPSGAGKDSVVSYARDRLVDRDNVVFCQRVITRGVDPHEAHFPVSETDFQRMAHEGQFLFAWAAHGNRYGIPRTILSELSHGKTVVANVSRTIIEAARAMVPDVLPEVTVVNITAPADVLAQRIAARGRETAEAIKARLSRSVAPIGNEAGFVHIENDKELSAAGDRMMALLCGGHVL